MVTRVFSRYVEWIIARPRIFGQKVAVYPGTPPTPAQKTLMRRFKEGIASALGVPPEAIKEGPVEKWVKEWTKAFVKPEYWTYPLRL